ncbi:2Fe-2S iron-sulfur cluster-binding protein [Marinimicrococcus flavescens]|uniref:2Fe-2S iron-sulfur cluster-binding protein n=1 Tax=Marinimicrococcus flavescens TaxID=3031815 RepID=A0AAP3XR77_9PROT|nr:2Fe-2S iron-sulfur cluster-binding protein [Marinimicrococcus flavescens]
MAKVVVVDREGVEHVLEGQAGWSVMEVIREAGLPIEAACGGCCACATCHVYVDEEHLAKLEEPQPDENMMLDEAFQVQDNSRLSCQLKFSDALDGIKVTLAPEF